MRREISEAQYMEILKGGADYCDCCGDKTKNEDLHEASMPDGKDPTILGNGFNVCTPCSSHCEEGPCTPDNLVRIVNLTFGYE